MELATSILEGLYSYFAGNSKGDGHDINTNVQMSSDRADSHNVDKTYNVSCCSYQPTVEEVIEVVSDDDNESTGRHAHVIVRSIHSNESLTPKSNKSGRSSSNKAYFVWRSTTAIFLQGEYSSLSRFPGRP